MYNRVTHCVCAEGVESQEYVLFFPSVTVTGKGISLSSSMHYYEEDAILYKEAPSASSQFFCFIFPT